MPNTLLSAMGTVAQPHLRRTFTPPRLGIPNARIRENIHAIWDRLADFDAAQVDLALNYLMQATCDLVDAQNAEWIGAVRLAKGDNDPAGGWRPPVVRFLHPTERLLAAIKEQSERIDLRLINEAAAAIIAGSGGFRAARLCDAVPPEWFESEFYKTYYRDCDREDAIYVAFAVNSDAESYFGIFRAPGLPHFTSAERDAIAYALRGIKWFHRQVLLSHGLLVAGTPLTQVERLVLQGLLTGQPEKQIAAELGQSYHTTHGYVTGIYRKFAVNNRPALMALWLGMAS